MTRIISPAFLTNRSTRFDNSFLTFFLCLIISLFFFVKLPAQVNKYINSSGSYPVSLLSDNEYYRQGMNMVDFGEFPPVWNIPENTGTVHIIVVLTMANPRINNVPILPGDFIGGFYTGDDGNKYCGGADVWLGNENIVFPLFGDVSPDTPKNGFAYGELISFRVFSYTSMKEYDVDVVAYVTGDPQYTTTNQWFPLGISGVNNMKAIVEFDVYASASPNPVCLGNDSQLSANVFVGTTGTYTFNWVSEPAGFVSNLQNPLVTPSQTTTYILTATDGMLISEHELTLTVNDIPVVNAGVDASICGNDTIQLSGIGENYAAIHWETSGDGTFSDIHSLSPGYTPGNQDNINGVAILTLNADPLPGCEFYVSDNLVLVINRVPVMNAGIDRTSCVNTPVPLDAQAQFYSSLLWTTSGSGTFTIPTSSQTIYNPSAADISNKSVQLSVCAYAMQPCTAAFCTTFKVTFQQVPTASAPATRLRCENQTVPIPGTASNYSTVTWITAGDGTFNDPHIPNVIYFPGTSDRQNGGTVVTMHVLPISPCQNEVTRQTVITLRKLPVADAGSTTFVCNGNTLHLNGTAVNYNYPYWTTLGDGGFDNPASLTAVYTPGYNDKVNGSFRLVLSATALLPCTLADSDTLDVTIIGAPDVQINMPDDLIICESENLQLESQVSGANELLWTTSGDGTFSDPAILNPVYYPGINDIATGESTLTLTASITDPCSFTSSDTKMIHIQKMPFVNAGDDNILCEALPYQLFGQANGYAGLQWETLGDGTFDHPAIVDPVYTFGYEDVSSGFAELILRAFPLSPCEFDVSDTIHIILAAPVVEDDQVVNKQLSVGETLELAFLVLNPQSGTFMWYHNDIQIAGEGLPVLNIPVVAPKDAGYYSCTFVNECGEVTSNNALVTIVQPFIQTINLRQGWSGVSSFVLPDDPDMNSVFGQLIPTMEIVANQGGIFWPSQNINTLGEWSLLNGYRIKMNSPGDLVINGSIQYPAAAITILQGWSYLAVNSACPVDIQELFGSTGPVRIIKEIAGWRLYWPESGIHTLTELLPGHAYEVFNTSETPLEFSYPACDE